MTGKDHRNQLIREELPDGSSSVSFEPLFLDAFFYTKSSESKSGYTGVEFKKIRIQLFKKGHPDWLEHPDPRNFDLAAMELEYLDVFCVNDKEQLDSIWIEAGADCFIVGYPEGISGPGVTPIWKRGSVASEPNVLNSDLPLFLTDSATRKGMSGSPVFIKAIGDFGREGTQRNTSFYGFWTKFVGVYSGRNGKDDDGFQLGRVWHGDLVEEMLAEPKLPNPFQKI